ncbi:MAG: hypothetical protein WKG00_29970 [Polyangiaceae bacterium]
MSWPESCGARAVIAPGAPSRSVASGTPLSPNVGATSLAPSMERPMTG